MNKRKHACLILSFGICLALLTGCGGHSTDDVMGSSGQSATAIQLNGSTASSDSTDVRIKQSTVTITAAGTYVLNGTLDDGMIVVNANKSADVQLILDGAAVSNSTSAAIYIKQAGSVTVTTAEGSENSLSNGGVYEAVDDANVDAVIFSKADLTLGGLGNLTIHAAAGGGVVSKDALIVTDGTYTITSEKDSLSGKDSVDIKGGVFTLVSDDDAIHTDGVLTISNGNILISESYEGLEGAQITIDGGSIELTAGDDGVNAATVEEDQTEDGCAITINGGSLLVNAVGDGLDSNGSILQTGGEVYVCGPTDSANSALDFETEIRLDGGIMIAVDDSEMQERMNGASAQGVIRTRIDPQPAGTEIVLKDAEDNVLLSFTPKKTYSTVTVSCPDIVQGADYTLFAGNTIVNISMETLLYDDISSGFGRP